MTYSSKSRKKASYEDKNTLQNNDNNAYIIDHTKNECDRNRHITRYFSKQQQ